MPLFYNSLSCSIHGRDCWVDEACRHLNREITKNKKENSKPKINWKLVVGLYDRGIGICIGLYKNVKVPLCENYGD